MTLVSTKFQVSPARLLTVATRPVSSDVQPANGPHGVPTSVLSSASPEMRARYIGDERRALGCGINEWWGQPPVGPSGRVLAGPAGRLRRRTFRAAHRRTRAQARPRRATGDHRPPARENQQTLVAGRARRRPGWWPCSTICTSPDRQHGLEPVGDRGRGPRGIREPPPPPPGGSSPVGAHQKQTRLPLATRARGRGSCPLTTAASSRPAQTRPKSGETRRGSRPASSTAFSAALTDRPPSSGTSTVERRRPIQVTITLGPSVRAPRCTDHRC